MFYCVIKSEFIKMRRAPVWVAFLALPLLAAVMGTFNYQQNTDALTKEWYSLWTQHTLFASFFFMPALIGIQCACQWRFEHMGNNWNGLMAQPVAPWAIVTGKLAVTALFVLLTQAFTGLLFYVSGKYAGLTGPPPSELVGWLMLGALGGVAIGAVQLTLSMCIRSFAIPVGIALGGGIVGLGAAHAGFGMYFPYSLLSLGMNANGMGRLTVMDHVPFVISCLAFCALASMIGIYRLTKKDVATV